MKIKRSELTVVLFVILVVAYLIFTVIYISQRQDQKAVRADIKVAEKLLGESEAHRSSLEQQLTDVEAELDADTVLDDVLELGQASQVKIVNVRSQLASDKQVGEHTFTVLPFFLRAEGEFSQLVAFVDRLEKEAFDTLLMKTMKIAQGGDSFALDLQFLIYTHPPDLEGAPQEATSGPGVDGA
jgi:septal ring factor EnvC (AmiA/AmiB activator)